MFASGMLGSSLRFLSTTIAALFAVALLATPPAHARITKIEIDAANSQNPTFGSTTFAESGAVYQKITGRVYGEVDPTNPHNTVIVDIGLAPTNEHGKVEYSANFVLLKPTDLAKGNHRLFTLVPNRGAPAGLSNMIGGAATITPTSVLTAANAGSGFLMRKGFSILIPGWDISANNASASSYSINVPVAKNPDGSSIVGPSIEEFVIDNDTTASGSLTYAAADLDKSKASLTFRVRVEDPPTAIPGPGWEYVNDRTIRLAGGANFSRGLYELVYPAKDPLVAGLGLAAIRDIVSFFRNETRDDLGTANPLAGDVQHVYTHCSSQPCRTMHDYLHLGFNQDERNRQVVDGILNWIGGGNFLRLNYRFSQAGRTHRQHIGRWYPEFEFPFSNNVIKDSVTGKTDGRMKRCLETNTCPKSFEVNSENEYWAKAGSNLHYDRVLGDLPDAPMTRTYLMSSLPHGAGTAPGICQQGQNPLGPYPVLRALLMALDDWVTSDNAPPASRVPRVDNNTLVRALPQEVNGFPNIPTRPAVVSGTPSVTLDTGLPVKYNGRVHTGDLFDYGPRYETEGILGNLPPVMRGSPYPGLVPKNDSDGNNIAGVRLPDVSVPLATYTGWALRALPVGADDGCDASGQKIPLRKTKAGRLAIHDPRPSLEERYSSRQDYVDKVTKAANDLKSAHLMLQEDVDAYISGAGPAFDAAQVFAP